MHYPKIKYLPIIVTVVLTLSLGGCIGRDNIGDISNNIEKYDGKEVNIKGEVTEELSIPLVSQGAYKIDDGTGSIWVVTIKGTPSKGKEVSVTGRVNSAFKIGTVSLGIVVLEESRK